jgi:hypothetical protein
MNILDPIFIARCSTIFASELPRMVAGWDLKISTEGHDQEWSLRINLTQTWGKLTRSRHCKRWTDWERPSNQGGKISSGYGFEWEWGLQQSPIERRCGWANLAMQRRRGSVNIGSLQQHKVDRSEVINWTLHPKSCRSAPSLSSELIFFINCQCEGDDDDVSYWMII